MSGAPLVLLHGLGSCGEDWALQVAEFAPQRRVVSPDLRGHGRSRRWGAAAGIADLAQDISRLVDELGAGPVHLAGLSLGGMVALQVAVDRPEQVRSLTVVNASARLKRSPAGGVKALVRLALVASGRMDALGRWVAAGIFPGEDQAELRALAAKRIAAIDPAFYRSALGAILSFDLRARLGEIAAPTLVVAGAEDRTVSLKAKRELAAGIPGAVLVMIPGSGHATPVDAAERFNAVLRRFLEGVEGQRESFS